jgi:hypothetical protein
LKSTGQSTFYYPQTHHRETPAWDTGDIPGMSSALMCEMRDLIALPERKLECKDAILLNIAEAMKDISLPTQEEEPS